MSNKFDGDVRPLSNDPRYMGVVFSGAIDDALAQAKAAPDHGLPEQPGSEWSRVTRDRWNLLEHLNLAPHFSTQAMLGRAELRIEDDSVQYGKSDADDALALQSEWEQGDKLMTWIDFKAATISKYSLEYALKAFPGSFMVKS